MKIVPAESSHESGGKKPVAEKRKWRDSLELAVGYGLILLVIWTGNPWQRWLYWAAIAWILLVTILSFDGRKAMGLGIAGFWRSLWVVGVALLGTAVAITLASRFHTLHLPHGSLAFLRRFWGYGIWALLQQFLIQDFVLLRLLRLLPGGKGAVAVAAGLFAVAHLPSPILAPAALCWGVAACLIFLKYRNIYTLGIAHAIFGICIAIAIPGPTDHNMRVGRGYLTYRSNRSNHGHHRNHSPHIVSTNAWVIADAPTLRS